MGHDDLDLIFLENVGNLICPAEFDTGSGKNVMILSVPEGDDKPLKYPLMFEQSDVLVITKTDVLSYFDFDLKKCRERVRKLNPKIQIFPVSAVSGAGMNAWEEWLKQAVSSWKIPEFQLGGQRNERYEEPHGQ
jgi:hydrogenase nickel incorporation protein HypB